MTPEVLFWACIGGFGFVLALTTIGMDYVDSRTTAYEKFLKEWNKKP